MTRHAALAAAVAGAVVVAGIADAKSSPNVAGQKHSDASSTLIAAGYKPIVSTTVGDRLASATGNSLGSPQGRAAAAAAASASASPTG
jgi:hypothetical protein